MVRDEFVEGKEVWARGSAYICNGDNSATRVFADHIYIVMRKVVALR